MNYWQQHLIQLLPAVHQLRDEEQKGPLKALTSIIGSQMDAVQQNIDELYGNWFIETCQPWCVPYLAELVGIDPLILSQPVLPLSLDRQRQRNRLLYSRREAAEALQLRKRKGTISVFADLVSTVTEWHCSIKENYQQVARLEADAHPGSELSTTGSDHHYGILSSQRLDQDGRVAWTEETIDIHVWRNLIYPVSDIPLESSNSQSGFNIYRLPDTTWFLDSRNPNTGSNETLPQPLTTELLAHEVGAGKFPKVNVDHYGIGNSLSLDLIDSKGNRTHVPASLVYLGSLTDLNELSDGPIVVFDLAERQLAISTSFSDSKPFLSYFQSKLRGFGGGNYHRSPHGMSETIRTVFRSFSDRPADWEKIKELLAENKPHHLVVEFVGEGQFQGPPKDLLIKTSQTLELRSRSGFPVLSGTALDLTLAQGGRLILDGVSTANVNLSHQETDVDSLDSDCSDPTNNLNRGDASRVIVRHCTLGILSVSLPAGAIAISDSIVAGITSQLTSNDLPVIVDVDDSAVEARSSSTENLSINGFDSIRLNSYRTTFMGKVHAFELFAQDCLFAGSLFVANRNVGGLRYCYDPNIQSPSNCPARYQCLPDVLKETHPDPNFLPSNALTLEQLFYSTNAKDPTFAVLRLSDDPLLKEIRTGSEEDSELGVYHDLYQAHRAKKLRQWIDEFTPLGMTANIYFDFEGGDNYEG